MSVSRRRFIKTGIVATVCAGLPLKSVLAGAGQETQSSSSDVLRQLSYYTKSTFDPYVNTRFRVSLSPTNTRTLKLTEVNDYLASLSQQAGGAITFGDESFTLLFTIPPGKPFPQDTYLIKHDALGTFYMFIVPVGGHSNTRPDFYEAVVCRRQQYSEWQDPITGTETKPAIVEGPASPGLNPRRVSEAVPAIIVLSKQNTKEERDIYRFRPAETESPAIAVQKNVQRAPKKAYPLTISQFGAISGLKLGMTSEQVLALFPGSKMDEEVRYHLDTPPTRFGVSNFRIIPARYTSKAIFDDVSQIIFTLLDGRVSTLYVGYDRPVWEHVDELVTNFSDKRNLPAPDQWEPYVGMDEQFKTLKCKDFEISLFAGGKNLSINYVQLRDLLAVQKHKERRAKAKGQ